MLPSTYLDEILVFVNELISKYPAHAELLTHVRAVLQKLKSAKLYAKLSKRESGLSVRKVKLGHIVSVAGIQPDADKMAGANECEGLPTIRRFGPVILQVCHGVLLYDCAIDSAISTRCQAWTPACS